jgi:hypothetical protein
MVQLDVLAWLHGLGCHHLSHRYMGGITFWLWRGN